MAMRDQASRNFWSKSNFLWREEARFDPARERPMSSFVQMFRIRLVVWLVLGAWGASSGKTIMWLGNFFQQGAFQNGTVYAVDSMWVQRSDSAGTQGYYFGARNQQLVKSTAFVDQAIAKSPLISWWSIPTWGGNLYRNGNLRLTLSYRQAYGTAPNQNIQAARNETQEMNGRYSAMPNVIDSCLDNIPGDTAWMYFGTGQESSAQTRPVCSDHNPYLQLKGTIHLLNPWPGRMAYVRWNGIWQPLYGEPGRPGWVVARFYALASATVDQQILFASADPADGAAGVQYMDMTGIGVANNLAPWNFTALATPWERWIAPPLDGTNIPKMLAAKPALTTTLMIRLPSWNAERDARDLERSAGKVHRPVHFVLQLVCDFLLCGAHSRIHRPEPPLPGYRLRIQGAGEGAGRFRHLRQLDRDASRPGRGHFVAQHQRRRGRAGRKGESHRPRHLQREDPGLQGLRLQIARNLFPVFREDKF